MKTKIFYNAGELPAEEWDSLAGRGSCTFSSDFATVIEESGLNDFRYRYVLISSDDDLPIALAVVYSVTTDLAIFAPAWLRRFLAGVRRVLPGFMKLRMLECGTPITLNSPPLAAVAGTSPIDLVAALDGVLREIASKERHLLIVVRDFEPGAEAWAEGFRRRRYHLVDMLPNTYLDVPWSSTEQYLGAMKSYFRSKLLGHLRKCREQGIHHTVIEDFADHAETLARQWLVVHSHADEFQREVLNADFYRRLSDRMGGKAKLIQFHRGQDWVGHALLLQDGDMLRWLYFGREEAANDSLYLYSGYAVIDTAIKLGAKRVEMGLTTYQIKQDLGAEVVPIRMALRAGLDLLNPIIGFGYGLLNHPPKARGSRNVFKQTPAAKPRGRKTAG